MDNLLVPNLSIVFMFTTFFLCFTLPIGIAIFIRKKYKANVSSFFIGCGIFILFALVFESIVNQMIIGGTGALGSTIRGNIWFYGLYGGLAAGLFEETGRFIAFKYLIKRPLSASNALMYGAGHGGIEAIILVGLSYISNIIISIMINIGNINSLVGNTPLDEVMPTFIALTTTPSYNFLLGGLERVFAIVLHIALSVLVYMAVKDRKKIFLYPLAIILHALVNFIAVVSSNYVTAYLVELFILILVVLVVLLTRKIYISNNDEMKID